ncbi:MAG TPA: putative nucleotidyltransferase substrate binding domain-containing protein [Geminicoccaceae bacterium]|nr:putative nucleotidyltransferase substrate binding domain-containing protein [Geminicoccaceae bacterium]
MPSSQTAVFRHIVKDHMAPPPVVVPAGIATVAAIAAMAEGAATAVVVAAADGALRGIVTEQDVVRRIRGHDPGRRPVEAFMTAPVLTVRDDAHLYEAIGFMRRHRLRHMPVLDAAGALAGMLDLHEALAVAAGPLARHIDRLTREDSFAGLAEVKAAQVELAESLFADNVPAPEIQALISDINNDLHRRVLRLCLEELETAGQGAPPVAFDAVVMGSGGRGESFLFPDQDNGFVLEDYPDEAHDTIDAWFVRLGERMTQELARLGFALCKGGVMATNPVWRKTLPQWRAQLLIWMRRRHPEMLLSADILVDFRAVYGDGGLARELRDFLTRSTADHPLFLRELFGIQADHWAGLGLFNRLLTERNDPAHHGHVNLKLAGTLPLAEGVRLLALAHRVPATGTLARIAALRERGAMGADEADHLAAAFAFVTGLQLRQQIRDFRAARPVGSFVDPRTLTEREVATLKDSFRAVNEFRTRLRADLTGELM